MDFTLSSYKAVLQALQSHGYSLITLAGYIKTEPKPLKRKSEIANPKLILLRHDVEARYQNAKQFAILQHEMGIRGSYYFRLYKKPGDESIIRSIADMGHEIGYHYDDLSYCKGNHEKAIIRFQENLNYLRAIAPVSTITMEGAPLSKYDNKDLWKHYNYRDFGIIGEPYFDLSFGSEFNHPKTPNTKHQTPNNFFYLTDTGRRWDGWRVSVRDKVPQQEEWIKQGLVFRSTHDIIKAVNERRLPDKIMMTFHPQRWTDKPLPWIKELLWQGVKNVGKRVLKAVRSER